MVLQALVALKASTQGLRDGIAATVHLVLPSLCGALSSSTDKVRQGAGEALDEMIRHVDSVQLVQVGSRTADGSFLLWTAVCP